MKQIIGIICAVAVLSSNAAFAQSAAVSAPAAGVNAPASALTFTPAVNTGVRSYLNGGVSQGFNSGDAAHTVGPFIIPQVEIGLKYPGMTGSLSYGAEITSARGFGDTKIGSKTFGQNTYIEHNPVLKTSFGANEWKFNIVADLKWHVENRDTDSTLSDYVLNPELERKLNDRISIAAGYVMDRINKFESNLGVAQQAASAKAAKKNNVVKAARLTAESTANMGVNPITTLHAATLVAKMKLGGGTALNTYVRAGRLTSNQFDKTGNQYRIQADLTTTVMQKLSLAIRYRLQLDDKDINEEGNQYMNLARLIAGYEVNKNWSIDLVNTFDTIYNTKQFAHAVYENEQYAGVTYKF